MHFLSLLSEQITKSTITVSRTDGVIQVQTAPIPQSIQQAISKNLAQRAVLNRNKSPVDVNEWAENLAASITKIND